MPADVEVTRTLLGTFGAVDWLVVFVCLFVLFLFVLDIVILVRARARRPATPQFVGRLSAEMRRIVENLEKVEERVDEIEEVLVGYKRDFAPRDLVLKGNFER